jgi:hypothetical protein
VTRVGEYRPSPLVRWPLHLLNVLLSITILALVAVVVLYRYMELEPPWALVWTGGGICLFFFLLNLSVATLRLWLDEQQARLRIWPFKRRVPWRGAEIRKVVRPVGVTAVRIVGADGKKIWVSQAWFGDFEDALAEIERLAGDAGAPIVEVDE